MGLIVFGILASFVMMFDGGFAVESRELPSKFENSANFTFSVSTEPLPEKFHSGSAKITSVPSRKSIRFYSASWCGYCKAPKSKLEAAVAAKSLPFDVQFIDVDKSGWFPIIPGKSQTIPHIEWESAVNQRLWLENPSALSIPDLIARWEYSQSESFQSTKTRSSVKIQSQSIQKPSYPTQSQFNWTGPDGVSPIQSKSEALNHLLNDSGHGSRFVRDFFSQLTLQELRAIHSDDHDRRIKHASIQVK